MMDYRKAYFKAMRWRFGRVSGLTLGENVMFRGVPQIDIVAGASAVIESDVVINSSNIRYHANMFAPTKILLDREGASVRIGQGSRVHGTCIHAMESIDIGERCLVAANTQIMDSNGHDLALDNPSRRVDSVGQAQPISIGNDVWIGLSCIVLPGVSIGSGSVITAGSVVTRDVPANVLAGGVPARVLRTTHDLEKPV